MSDAEINPYASPLASLAPEVVAHDEIWRDGSLLVVRKGSSLPDRCVKCNAPADGLRLRTKLYWHHPELYFLLVFSFAAGLGLLAYVIVRLVVIEMAEFQIGVCRRHLRRRHIALAVGFLAPLASIAAIASCAAADMRGREISVAALGICWALPFVGPAVGLFFAVIVWPKKIDADFAWVKGVCREYLAELPQAPPEILRARLARLP